MCRYLLRSDEDVGFPGTGVPGSCEPPSEELKEQPALLSMGHLSSPKPCLVSSLIGHLERYFVVVLKRDYWPGMHHRSLVIVLGRQRRGSPQGQSKLHHETQRERERERERHY